MRNLIVLSILSMIALCSVFLFIKADRKKIIKNMHTENSNVYNTNVTVKSKIENKEKSEFFVPKIEFGIANDFESNTEARSDYGGHKIDNSFFEYATISESATLHRNLQDRLNSLHSAKIMSLNGARTIND